MTQALEQRIRTEARQLADQARGVNDYAARLWIVYADQLRALCEQAAAEERERLEDGIRFDEQSQTWVARYTVLTAARTEEEARKALAGAVRLVADAWPPRGERLTPKDTEERKPLGCACAKYNCPGNHDHGDFCSTCPCIQQPPAKKTR